MTTDAKSGPSAAELMALVDAYADTAAVNGIRSQWAQMARGKVELALKQLPAPQAQADARDASRCGKRLTVVYQNVQPGDEAREIGSHSRSAEQCPPITAQTAPAWPDARLSTMSSAGAAAGTT